MSNLVVADMTKAGFDALLRVVYPPGAHRAPSLVIHGPTGCGKTTHAAALADHFGFLVAVDVDDPSVAEANLVPSGVLYLSARPLGSLTELQFAEAMAQLAAR